MNRQLENGQIAEAKSAYEKAAQAGYLASDCITHGQCERACPQHLPITDLLKQGAEMFEA